MSRGVVYMPDQHRPRTWQIWIFDENIGEVIKGEVSACLKIKSKSILFPNLLILEQYIQEIANAKIFARSRDLIEFEDTAVALGVPLR